MSASFVTSANFGYRVTVVDGTVNGKAYDFFDQGSNVTVTSNAKPADSTSGWQGQTAEEAGNVRYQTKTTYTYKNGATKTLTNLQAPQTVTMGYNTKTEQINKQRYQQQATTIPSDTPSITHVWAYGKEEYHSDEGTVDTDVSGDGEWRGNQIKVAVSGTTIWAEFRGSDANNVVVTCKVTMRYSDGSTETQEKTAYNADSCARVDFSLTDYRKSVTVYTSYGWVNI